MTHPPSPDSEVLATQVQRRVWRAPATDRTAVVVPEWSAAPELLAENRTWFAGRGGALDWSSWRAQTRHEVLDAAVRYTAQLTGQPLAALSDGPVIVGGHQPELFHPGVWAKNFAIARLAEQNRGVSLQLIVDHDLHTQSAIRVPVGTTDSPHFVLEPFDTPQLPQPWEAVRVADRQVFATFADRIAGRMETWSVTPLVTAAWPTTVAQLSSRDSLVDGLTAARVAIERSWGLGNLELPVSRLCALPSFLQFAALLVSRASDVVAQYNSVVHDYRVLNRVRSRAHPVADLATEGEWLELPLWIWRTGDRRRLRPFVRRFAGQSELRADGEVLARWPADESRAVEVLSAFAAQGLHLRPRALTLTLFARLFLADLFVHGLGGAKYDEMTDALAARLFGTAPPPFLTVSATVRLPLGDMPAVSPSDIGRVRHQLWDLPHNPQRYIDPADSTAATLVAEKRSLLNAPSPSQRTERRRRYLRLRAINAELAGRLAAVRDDLSRQQQELMRLSAGQRVRHNREWSWVLHPAASLRAFYETTFPL